MKQLLLFLLLSAGIALSAQNVTYTYDAAGNRTQRVITLSSKSLPSQSLNAATPLEDLVAERKVKIYPNPTKGMLAVEVDNLEGDVKGEFSIHNAAGSLIKKQKTVSGKATFDLTSQPTGVYFLRIRLGDEVNTWKIIKE
jgi:hypothetical protein